MSGQWNVERNKQTEGKKKDTNREQRERMTGDKERDNREGKKSVRWNMNYVGLFILQSLCRTTSWPDYCHRRIRPKVSHYLLRKSSIASRLLCRALETRTCFFSADNRVEDDGGGGRPLCRSPKTLYNRSVLPRHLVRTVPFSWCEHLLASFMLHKVCAFLATSFIWTRCLGSLSIGYPEQMNSNL